MTPIRRLVACTGLWVTVAMAGLPAVTQPAAAQPAAAPPAAIPPVLLSKGHEALCRVNVGDAMPAIELAQLGGDAARLADFYGQRGTVVAFWRSDRRASRTLLADLGPDVVEPFGPRGIRVVTIAVGEPAASVGETLQQTGGVLPTLLDVEGEAFAQVGSEKLPRIYLLDPQGRILWFDIEYSLATRRELRQALRAITPGPR